VLVELELKVVGSHREVLVRGLIGEMMVSVLVRGLVGLVVVLLDVLLLVLIGFRGDDRSFGFQRNYGPRFPSSWCSYSLHGAWEVWWQGNDVC
jgi:hypothetical protein